MDLFIKICGDPHCDQVHHNTPKKKTKCLNCNGNLIVINKNTYLKKYKDLYFQVDCSTQDYYYPYTTSQLTLF